MSSHLHLIIRAKNNDPATLLGRFKEYTSKNLVKSIDENSQESCREWMLDMFKKEGTKRSNMTTNQFWQHDNRPIELWSQEVLEQKVDYTHNNPVVAGLVLEPWHWQYSSAIDYSGGKGLIELDL